MNTTTPLDSRPTPHGGPRLSERKAHENGRGSDTTRPQAGWAFWLLWGGVVIFLLLTGAPFADAFTLNISNDTDSLGRVQLYETGQNLRYFYAPPNTSVTVQLPDTDDLQLDIARRYGGGDGMTWVGEATYYTAVHTTPQTVIMAQFDRNDGAGIRVRHFTTTNSSAVGTGVTMVQIMTPLASGMGLVVVPLLIVATMRAVRKGVSLGGGNLT